MKRKTISVLLALVLCLTCALPVFAESDTVTEEQAYQAMIALQEQYPNGMSWTNDNFYGWNGGIYSGGYGCAGFAFLLSDAAFGELPAREVTDVKLAEVRVGDVLRINNDTHSVIVLEVYDDHVVIAEGNYNRSINWGRTLTKSKVEAATYLLTRYPDDMTVQEPNPTPTPTPGPEHPDPANTTSKFTDVSDNAWYAEAVNFMADNGILKGYSDGTFKPNDNVTLAELATVLSLLNGDTEIANEHHWAGAAMFKFQYGYDFDTVYKYRTEGGDRPDVDYSYANTPANRGDVLTYMGLAARYGSDAKIVHSDVEIPDMPADANTGTNSLDCYDGHAIAWAGILDAYRFGVAAGVDAQGTCDAYGTLTRAQLAQMCYNMGWSTSGCISYEPSLR